MYALPFLLKPHSLGAIATGNERSEKPAAHLGALDAIGMVWRSNGTSNLWVRGNFGAARPVDFLSIIHANALPSTTYRLRLGDSQAEVDGTADYDSGTLTFIDPAITRNDGLYSSHLELPAVVSKQWWRIDFGGHTGDLEVAGMVFGQKTTPSRFYSAGFEFGSQDMGSLSITPFGIPDREDGLVFDTMKFSLGWLDEPEYEFKIRPLLRSVGKRQLIFACFDPSANAYRQSRSMLGWLQDNPYGVGGKIRPGSWSQDISILSMIGADSDISAIPDTNDELTATSISAGTPSLGAPALAQRHTLTATGITTTPTLGTPALSFSGGFVANPIATGAPSLGGPALTQNHVVTATGIATGAPSLGAPGLTQGGQFSANNLVIGTPSLGNPALAQVHGLTATAIAAGAPSLGAPALTSGNGLSANNITIGTPSLGLPALSQNHVVTATGITASPALGTPALDAGEDIDNLLFEVPVGTSGVLFTFTPAITGPWTITIETSHAHLTINTTTRVVSMDTAIGSEEERSIVVKAVGAGGLVEKRRITIVGAAEATPENTYANTTDVYANADGFSELLADIEDQIDELES